jgi:PilZ domain
MDERRKRPRRRILKSATIRLGKQHAIPCAVRNLSEIGACLVVQATFGITGGFQLLMPGHAPRTCKVIWSTDTKLGVEFQASNIQ